MHHVRGAGWARTLPLFTALGACAATHEPAPAYPASMSEAEEAQAIAAARRHPIAQPQARSLYPDQAPPPVPVRAASSAAPPGTQPQFVGGGSPSSGLEVAAPGLARNAQAAVAPAPPPSDYADAPQYAAPGQDYVWAPGYWWWSGSGYVWVAGDWLRSRPGYVYVGPRWARSGYGWEFSVGGWARGGTGIVIYPEYRHPYQSYQSYYAPSYYDSRRLAEPGNSRYRGGYGPANSGYSHQEVHVTPEYPGRGTYRNSYNGPRSAPAAVDRSSSTAGPGTANSAPPVTQAIRVGGGAARSSQRATVRTRH
jgi:hypothetical protein